MSFSHVIRCYTLASNCQNTRCTDRHGNDDYNDIHYKKLVGTTHARFFILCIVYYGTIILQSVAFFGKKTYF